MNSLTTSYPQEILAIAESSIKKHVPDTVAIIPIYKIGFIAVIDTPKEPICYLPFIQDGSYGKDFIKVSPTMRVYYNYQEAIVALIAYKTLGESFTSATYVDVFCNKMGVTAHSNAVSNVL